jgi:hypothetical protein
VCSDGHSLQWLKYNTLSWKHEEQPLCSSLRSGLHFVNYFYAILLQNLDKAVAKVTAIPD